MSQRSAPDFVIAGAPKCGTTSLHHWLHQHPDIHMIRGEPHYFAHDLDYNQPPMSASRYASLCQAAGDRRLCGDRSTWYLYSDAAPAAIQSTNPDARILILLRQPAELLHSWHAHLCQRGARESLTRLSDAMAAEDQRRAGQALPNRSGFLQMYQYSAMPDYVSGIERFQAAFPAEQIKIVLL
ncbi:MAG: sulfotransferase, partial [Pseudomonadota bacterium]